MTRSSQRRTTEDDNNAAALDEHGVVKDGHSLRVSLMMRDAARPDHGVKGDGSPSNPYVITTGLQLQNDVRTPAKVTGTVDVRAATLAAIGRVADADPFAGHRPGYRGTVDAIDYGAADRARADGIASMVDAWKTPPVRLRDDSEEGDDCTCKNGDDGTFVRNDDGSLTCVAGGDDQQDARRRPTGDARVDSYNAYVSDLENAWRGK